MGVEVSTLFIPSKKGFGHSGGVEGCSTFSREKEFRNLLPFPLSPEPTKAETELSMKCAHGEPISPDHHCGAIRSLVRHHPRSFARIQLGSGALAPQLNLRLYAREFMRADDDSITHPGFVRTAVQKIGACPGDTRTPLSLSLSLSPSLSLLFSLSFSSLSLSLLLSLEPRYPSFSFSFSFSVSFLLPPSSFLLPPSSFSLFFLFSSSLFSSFSFSLSFSHKVLMFRWKS